MTLVVPTFTQRTSSGGPRQSGVDRCDNIKDGASGPCMVAQHYVVLEVEDASQKRPIRCLPYRCVPLIKSSAIVGNDRTSNIIPLVAVLSPQEG